MKETKSTSAALSLWCLIIQDPIIIFSKTHYVTSTRAKINWKVILIVMVRFLSEFKYVRVHVDIILNFSDTLNMFFLRFNHDLIMGR